MKDHDKILNWIIGIFISGTIIILLTIFAYYRSNTINFCNNIDTENISSFGTFIGGFVGTIFSIGTALLVYITYKSQSGHLKRQTEHINNTENHLGIQRFEDKFFRLLEIHENIKRGIQMNSRDFLTQVNGIAYDDFAYPKIFSVIKDDFERFYNSPTIIPNINLLANYDDYNADDIPSLDQYEARIKYKYDFFFRRYEEYLGHYFRNGYHILKFIDKEAKVLKQEFGDKDNKIDKLRKFYIDVFKSQLTVSERVVVFYNSFAFENAKKRLISSKLLGDIKTKLINIQHSTLYPEGYFKD